MKILSRAKKSEQQSSAVSAISGRARAELDAEGVSRKLGDGHIAVIDHADIGRTYAELLIERGVRAVVNASASTTGRYPNLGPQLLAKAGIAIVDNVGSGIFAKFKNGDQLSLDEEKVYRNGVLIATGVELTDQLIADQLQEADKGLSTRLESLSVNAAEHLRRERTMLLENTGIPSLGTKVRGRPALVVSKTYGYADDLAGLDDYIGDYNPVLIGAGAGADALIDAGRVPDVVVGSLDNLSDRALKQSKEVVITSASSKVASVDRLEKAGSDSITFIGAGSDEDLALMLADANGASVVVLAGGHNNLVEFLERGPTEMASTFLARLKIGNKLVDAKAVTEFYNHKLSAWPVILLAIAGVIAVAVAVAATPVGQSWFDGVPDLASDLVTWAKGLFS